LARPAALVSPVVVRVVSRLVVRVVSRLVVMPRLVVRVVSRLRQRVVRLVEVKRVVVIRTSRQKTRALTLIPMTHLLLVVGRHLLIRSPARAASRRHNLIRRRSDRSAVRLMEEPRADLDRIPSVVS